MRYGYEILEDRYFSDYDYEDALYERAFSEGYEYALEYLFSEDDDKRARNAALATAGLGVAGIGGGLGVTAHGVKGLSNDAKNLGQLLIERHGENAPEFAHFLKNHNLTKAQALKIAAGHNLHPGEIGDALRGVSGVANKYRKIVDNPDKITKLINTLGADEMLNSKEIIEEIKNEKAGAFKNEKLKDLYNSASKNVKKLRAGRYATLAGAGLLTAGAGMGAANYLNKKSKKDKNK